MIKHGLNSFKSTLPQGVADVVVNDEFGDTSALLVAVESDSRDYRLGTVDTRYVIGKAAFLIFPGPDYETEKRDFKRIGVIWS